jgi:atypical dual specificity phosphatase
MYIEWREPGAPNWQAVTAESPDKWSSDTYKVYDALAGGRNGTGYLYPHKGLPEDISDVLLKRACYRLFDNDEEVKARAYPEFVMKRDPGIGPPIWGQIDRGGTSYVYDRYMGSYTWLTLQEVKRSLENAGLPLDTLGPACAAIIRQMSELEAAGKESRLILWFGAGSMPAPAVQFGTLPTGSHDLRLSEQTSLRILYVEDRAEFAASVISRFLSQHSVTVALSLAEARQALAGGGFDLLLIDYDLDDGKGNALIREMREAGESRPALGISSHDEGCQAMLQAGAAAVFGKRLIDQVQQVIDMVSGRKLLDAGRLLWWVLPGVLAGMPMPFIHPQRRLNQDAALLDYEDDLTALYAAGIRAVVSLEACVGWQIYESAGPLFGSAGFNLYCMWFADGTGPSVGATQQLIEFVEYQLKQRQAVAVYSEAGAVWTGAVLAAYLISKGQTAESAIRQIRMVDHLTIEAPAQTRFLKRFAAAIRAGGQTRYSSV